MTSATNSDVAFSFAICRWPDRSALNLLARFTTLHREAMAQHACQALMRWQRSGDIFWCII